MITIYSATETNFTTMGLGTLAPISCAITEDINGQYELDMQHPIDEDGKWKRLVNDRIIKAPTHDGDQLFRIYSAVKNPITGRIDVNARHIFYDLLDNLIEDTRPTVKTGQQAGNEIIAGCQYEAPFLFTSDITAVSTAYYVRVNPVQAMLGSAYDQSFINRWGGEIRRNNFAISINTRRGSDKGVRIAYGKNLTGLEATEDISSVYTRIMPTAVNDSNVLFTTDAKYYNSPLIGNYAHPKIGILDTGIRVGVEVNGVVQYPTIASAKTAMAAMAAAAFEKGADKPKLTINVSFIRWQDTDEYAAYKDLYTLDLGDDVTVDYAPLSLTYNLRVTSIVWDAVLNKAVSLTLGDLAPNIARSVADTNIDLSMLRNDVAGALQEGQAYNNVTITNAKGIETSAVISGKTITVRQNAQSGFAIYEGATLIGGVVVEGGKVLLKGNAVETTAVIGGKTITINVDPAVGLGVYDGTTYKGGVAVVNGEVVNVSSLLTNDINGDVYSVIGTTNIPGIGTVRGLLIYNKLASTTEPAFIIYVSNAGWITLYNKLLGTSVGMYQNTFTYIDANGRNRFDITQDYSWMISPDGNANVYCSNSETRLNFGSKRLGVDATGYFKQEVGGSKVYF